MIISKESKSVREEEGWHKKGGKSNERMLLLLLLSSLSLPLSSFVIISRWWEDEGKELLEKRKRRTHRDDRMDGKRWKEREWKKEQNIAMEGIRSISVFRKSKKWRTFFFFLLLLEKEKMNHEYLLLSPFLSLSFLSSPIISFLCMDSSSFFSLIRRRDVNTRMTFPLLPFSMSFLPPVFVCPRSGDREDINDVLFSFPVAILFLIVSFFVYFFLSDGDLCVSCLCPCPRKETKTNNTCPSS